MAAAGEAAATAARQGHALRLLAGDGLRRDAALFLVSRLAYGRCMSDVTIYHNPNCGTSRNTLALLREKGIEPTVVEYLKQGWTKPQLEELLGQMKVSAR